MCPQANRELRRIPAQWNASSRSSLDPFFCTGDGFLDTVLTGADGVVHTTRKPDSVASALLESRSVLRV